MKFFKRNLITIASLMAINSVCLSAVVSPTETAANDIALTSIGAKVAWSRGYTGLNSRIGFVDTGADLKNKDLKNVILSKSPYYTNMIDVNGGHGTEMISLAAGAKDGTGIMGVAYNANAMIYAGGFAGFLFVTDVNNGIRWNAE
ncbi:MAG: hypothetical protein EBU90_24490 [Proteobacteria bacterium]|nr:hypothetical protein [Pseudomonadota bacterium]